ncbi:MAG TPA: hypothetical protein VFX28_08440, partial [Methylomirabilota bacterium]|nr:hypothetical protein [Methylomirabilota bacterium]
MKTLLAVTLALASLALASTARAASPTQDDYDACNSVAQGRPGGGASSTTTNPPTGSRPVG